MTITLIAAMDRNRVIGCGNQLPWRLPAEMAIFTSATTGKTVLMGRKTFESLRKPLTNRRNVIITRQSDFKAEGCEVVHSVAEALERYGRMEDDLMIMGGAEIYKELLPFADAIILSEVDTEVEGGDAYFPEFDLDDWSLMNSKFRQSDEKNKFSFTTRTYKRN